MTITIEPTGEVVILIGVVCRIWEGATARGVPLRAAVSLLEVAPEHAPAFEAEAGGGVTDVTDRVRVFAPADPGVN